MAWLFLPRSSGGRTRTPVSDVGCEAIAGVRVPVPHWGRSLLLAGNLRRAAEGCPAEVAGGASVGRAAGGAGSAEALGEADPRCDPELAVRRRQVDFDGLGGHEEGLGDVAVAVPLGGQSGYPALAGGEGLHAGTAHAAGPRPGRRALVNGLPA